MCMLVKRDREMKKEFIFIGPPGSGKGTQTKMLSEEYKLPHIDTGALLREEIASGSENGKLADSFMSKGQFLPFSKETRCPLSSPKTFISINL